MQRRSVNKLTINHYLLLVSFVFSLLAGYVVLRALPVHVGEASYDRHLLFSRLQFRVKPDGATHYVENENIREIGVYAGRIEYDISYRTNNLGLIDSRDYADDIHDADTHHHYAFVGDSFTAGSGGGPWVSDLRDKLAERDPSFQIYNLGVAGTGCVQFEKILSSLSSRFQFKKIFILAISDDLNRMPWRPMQTEDELRFCGETESTQRCLKRPPTATLIEYDSTSEDIASRLALLNKKSLKPFSPTRPGLFYKIKLLVKRALNLNALKKIRKNFPDSEIVFIHLPQREEVLAGKYYENLKNQIKALGLSYFSAMECGWSRDLFLPNDPHPNKQGYARLSACLEENFF